MLILSAAPSLELPKGRGCLSHFGISRPDCTGYTVGTQDDIGWLNGRMAEWLTQELAEARVLGGQPLSYTHTHMSARAGGNQENYENIKCGVLEREGDFGI